MTAITAASAKGTGVRRIAREFGVGVGTVLRVTGEAGAIGASAAVINAITDAIGSNKIEMPASPDRVWHAIHG